MSNGGHAPRGRLKAPTHQGPTPAPVKCHAHSSRTGKPCQRYPIAGATVCRVHGGAARQVKAAAARRLADLVPAAIKYWDWLLGQHDYPHAGLGAANAVWDREHGRPRESVSLEHSGGLHITHELPDDQSVK